VAGDQLTFVLTQPAGDFLARLSMPFFCAVPLSAPLARVTTPLPSAGPYYIADRNQPAAETVLRPNPNYPGPRLRRFDEILIKGNQSFQQIRAGVEAGDADFGNQLPIEAHAELGPLYGPEGPTAALGRQRYFVNPAQTFSYVAMNTSRPLFSDVNLRKAVNFAIDRPVLRDEGGAYAGSLTDQYLPAVASGSRDAQIYPLLGPNLERARELAGWQPGDPLKPAVLYTCGAGNPGHVCMRRAARVKEQLAQIGIDVSIQSFTFEEHVRRQSTRGEPFDLSLTGWAADYPDPYDFLFPLDGSTIHDGEGNINIAFFSEPEFDQRLHEAQQLTGDDRLRALGDLDVDATQRWAPLAAYMNPNVRDFYSDRIGCHVYHPVYGASLTAVCLRPEVAVGDVSVSETTPEAHFTISLSSVETESVAVAYATSDGAATAGADYTPAAGTVTFAPGERVKAVSVPIKADELDESDETFALDLVGATRGTLVDGRGLGTIVDDDLPPAVPPDLAPPRDPTIASRSHKPGVAIPDATVDLRWTGASDDVSGVDGYSFVWDSSPATVPDTVKDGEESTVETTSQALAPGRWHYFHLRTRDNAGNWSRGVHAGPFVIARPLKGGRRLCVVPNVRGKSLAAAKARLRRAGCRVGTIRRVRSITARKGRIVGQTPRPGKRLKAGGLVHLRVSDGR
jgi:Bacterial extracellular solute-binding proteins, family 5 Middle/Calx-beta domain/PASTA domain